MSVAEPDMRSPLYVNIERLCADEGHPLVRALAQQVRIQQHFTLGSWLAQRSEAELDELLRLCSAAQAGDEAALRDALLLTLTLALAEGLDVARPEEALAMLGSILTASGCAKLARRGELTLDWSQLSLEPDAPFPVRLSDAGYRRLERRARG
jgi:hypothetical protein